MTENEILNEIREMNHWIVKKLHGVLIVQLTGGEEAESQRQKKKREFEDRHTHSSLLSV